MEEKKQKEINKSGKAICNRCKKEILKPTRHERYVYKNIKGEEKVIHCCLDCQLNLT